MRKFILKNGKSFESDYQNDIAPVVVAKHTAKSPVDEEKLYSREDLKDEIIYQHHTNTFDEKTNELIPCVFYYVGARAENTKEYRHISEYDSDFPPQKPLIEVILQVENFKKKIYVEMSNVNCTFFDLIDFAIEEILEQYSEDEEDYTSIYLYDDGGWEIDVELGGESDLKEMITGIRLVEEINE